MTWFVLALIPPILFAACNFIDKFVVARVFPNESVGVFIFAASFVTILFAAALIVVDPTVLEVPWAQAILIAANGALYMLALVPYIMALSQASASVVAPLFQLRQGLVLLLGYLFLNEQPTAIQIVGMVAISSGVVLVSSERTEGRSRFRGNVVLLMLLSSTMLGVYTVLFKYLQLESGFWPTKFWEYVGESLVALSFGLSAVNRRRLALAWQQSGSVALIPLMGTEVLNIAGVLLFTYALTLGPIAMVSTVAGIHPLFLFLFGIALARLLPSLGEEALSKEMLLLKGLGTALIVFGCVLIGQIG
jgi:drug/metabolite transporter (DMT)-like permease